jgi:hypothetical protein
MGRSNSNGNSNGSGCMERLFRAVLLIAFGALLAYLFIVQNRATLAVVHSLIGETSHTAGSMSSNSNSPLDGFKLPDPLKGFKMPSLGSAGASLSTATGSNVVGGPSISAATVNRVLASAGSPAAGTGDALYSLSQQYGIDDAYALAVFKHESSYGTNGAARQTHALGNIICAGYSTCIGRFRSYPGLGPDAWIPGYADFYKLIKREYAAKGLSTVETITPVYAPSSDGNAPLDYEQSVLASMDAYRRMG